MKLTENDIKLDHQANGDVHITIQAGEYTGIEFKFGKVWFENEESEQPTMHFHYDIITGTPEDRVKFEEIVAHLLYDIMMRQLENNEIIYTGGVEGEPESRIIVPDSKITLDTSL